MSGYNVVSLVARTALTVITGKKGDLIKNTDFGKVDFSSPKPLYLQISELIKKKIENKEIFVGHKLPNQEELRKIFNVSLNTIKEAMSCLVKSGHVACRPTHGSIVINSKTGSVDFKAKNKIELINFLSTTEPDSFTGDFMSFHGHRILRGIEEKVREKGIHLIYKNVGKNELGLKEIKNEIAGLIIMGMDSPERLREVQKSKLPFILVEDIPGKKKTDGKLDVVAANDFEIVYMATKYLIDSGHRRIAYINSSIDKEYHNIEQMRGYKQALKEAGIILDKALLMETGRFDMQEAYKAINKLIDKKKPFTGIVCINVVNCMGVTLALAGKDLKVPKDISIVVCDKSPGGITSVEYDVEELGRRAVGLLIEKLENPADWKPRREIIPSKLNISGSVKKIGLHKVQP